MKHRNYVRAGCTIAACVVAVGLCTPTLVSAENEVTCFVISGNDPEECCIDLSKLNRITFGPESMIVSSSKGDIQETGQLLYSLYHHIEIKSMIPNIDTGVEMSVADNADQLLFLSDSRSLMLYSEESGVFTVGIFDLDGRMAMTAEMTPGEPFPLERLPEGIYVAVATDKRINLNIKFRLR